MAVGDAVLVVDDDRDLVATLREFLEGQGYPVTAAHSGAAARRALAGGASGVVLLDLFLPDGDGTELLHEAQRLATPPEVVVLTGHATLESAIAAVEAGAAGYLTKPFDLARLGALVRRAFERARLRRENARLAGELAERLREREALLAISTAVGATLDLREALRRLCRELARLLGADTASAYVHDPASDHLVPYAGYHVPKDQLGTLVTLSLPVREQGFYLPIWDQRRPVYSDDVANDARFTHEAFRRFAHQSGLILPLILDGQVAGGFYLVWWTARRRFTERELALAETICGEAALLLRSAQLYADARRHGDRLETLARVTRAMSTAPDPDAVFQTIAEAALSLYPGGCCRLWVVDGERVRLVAETGTDEAHGGSRVDLPLGEGLVGHVCAASESVVLEDVSAFPDLVNADWMRAQGFVSVAGLPLAGPGRVLGALVVLTRERHPFDDGELAVLRALAEHAAVTLEKARHFRDAEERRRLLEALYALTLEMQANLDLGARLDAFVAAAPRSLGFDRVNVLLVDEAARALRCVAGTDLGVHTGASLPLDQGGGAFETVLRTGRTLTVTDDDGLAALPPLAATLREHPVLRSRRFAVVPLAFQGRPIGVVAADNKPTRRPITRRAVAQLELFCQALATSVENARLYAASEAREREATRVSAGLALLNRASQVLLRTLDLEPLLRDALDQLATAFGADAALVNLFTEEGRLRHSVGRWLSEAHGREVEYRPAGGVSGLVREARAPLFLRDVAERRDVVHPAHFRHGVRSLAALPITGREARVRGALFLYYTTPQAFPEQETRLLAAYADQLGAALENAQLYEEAQAREREARQLYAGLTLLNQAGRALHRTLDVDAMLSGALDELARAVGASGARVDLRAQDDAPTRSVGRWVSDAHGRDVVLRKRGGVSQVVRRTRRPLLLRDIAEHRDIVNPAHFAHGVTSLAALPIVGQHDRVLGVLFLYYTTVQAFPEHDVRFLVAYADQLATALENAQLYEETQAQRTRLRQIFDSTSDGIILVGRMGFVEAANRRAGELLRFDPDAAVGRGPAELLAGLFETGRAFHEAVSGIRALLADPERGGRGEFAITVPPKRVLHWTGQPTKDATGATIGLTLTFRDVTEEREVGQMKSEFVSFVTHQLRTPLAGIKWMLELTAQVPDLSDEARGYVQDAHASNERLVLLVNDLLNVARLESGKLKIAPEPVRLDAVTRAIVEELAPLVRDKGHRLAVVVEEALPPVMLDLQLFRQVALNLLSNAIKYTKPGGEVEVRIGAAGETVRWAVRDSGVGIPADAQYRLFEKFFRADNVVTLETEGTGLGLYLVRLIVEQFGGRVWCESEEGRGSTFIVELPPAR